MAMVLSAAMMCRYGLNLPEVNVKSHVNVFGSGDCQMFNSKCPNVVEQELKEDTAGRGAGGEGRGG
jgi:hypothetical protein